MTELSIDFKVDGKVVGTHDMGELDQSTFHKYHVCSYMMGQFEVDGRMIDFNIRIELPINVAKELGWK